MTEWPIVQHWKCCVPQGTEGSNPSLSATFRGDRTVASFLCENEETDCKTLVFSVLCGSGIMKIAKNMYFPPKRKRQPFVYERRIDGRHFVRFCGGYRHRINDFLAEMEMRFESGTRNFYRDLCAVLARTRALNVRK